MGCSLRKNITSASIQHSTKSVLCGMLSGHTHSSLSVVQFDDPILRNTERFPQNQTFNLNVICVSFLTEFTALGTETYQSMYQRYFDWWPKCFTTFKVETRRTTLAAQNTPFTELLNVVHEKSFATRFDLQNVTGVFFPRDWLCTKTFAPPPLRTVD